MYDFIIAGAGSAGALVAAELVRSGARVLLLEAGGRDSSLLIHMPAGFQKLLAAGRFLYPYETTPQTQLDGNPRPMIAAKGLGGGSSLNAMCWVVGQPRDYEGWSAAAGGTEAWSHTDLLPHFRKIEANTLLDNEYHGASGPIRVSYPPRINPLNAASVRAFQEAGLPCNPDYNGADQRGVGPVQSNFYDARRYSSAYAYLRPLARDSNLVVETHATVHKLVFDGDRVVGVEYHRNGRAHTAHAGEVILSAGALNSPRVLMLSGIGPEDELKSLGIPVKVSSPDVGANLQDHAQVPVMVECREKWGYYRDAVGYRMLLNGMRFLAFRDGPASGSGIETNSYFNPDDLSAAPTIQSFHNPALLSKSLGKALPKPGITFVNVVMQPRSRGYVKLRDTSPTSAPLINPNWFSDPEDVRKILGGLRYIREVIAQPALKDVLYPEMQPGVGVEDEEQLKAYVKSAASTMWHPVGTCRMGADERAVVDASLRVRGVRNLRVVDASIMPNITSGNTNAPTMALASKAVDLILAQRS
jgi:choline dehydrogenase